MKQLPFAAIVAALVASPIAVAAAQAHGAAFGSPIGVKSVKPPEAAFASAPAPNPAPASPVPTQIIMPAGAASLPSVVDVPPLVQNVQAQLARVTSHETQGARVVTLPWHPHETYQVACKVGMFTTFSFPKNEPILQFAVSDPNSVELSIVSGANAAMLRLKNPISEIITVLTARRAYYINFTPASGAWDQGVSWSYDDADTPFGASNFGGGLYSAPNASVPPESAAPTAGVGDAEADGLFTGQPNFDYRMEGAAPFRPVAVWDNGRFTWIQFRNNIQELPALFAKGPNGLEIVNYTVHDHSTQLLVNRLLPEFVLKLGTEEITVTAGH